MAIWKFVLMIILVIAFLFAVIAIQYRLNWASCDKKIGSLLKFYKFASFSFSFLSLDTILVLILGAAKDVAPGLLTALIIFVCLLVMCIVNYNKLEKDLSRKFN